MADHSNSPQPATADLQQAADIVNAMAPTRRARATASPSPAPHARGSTPLDSVNGRLTPARGGSVRADVPAKYSTSYGSPITQLPDRSNVGGGGNVTKAAAEIFSKVKKDNQAAESRRRTKDQARAARAGPRAATGSPQPPKIRPTIEMDDESEEPDEVDETSGGEGSEYEDEADQRSRRAAARKPAHKAARKRTREDDEAEARAEKERKERDARLRRERSAEARKLRNQKLADAAAAAREQAAKERLAEQAAREEAARAAMPPPPLPEITMTPPTARLPVDVSSLLPNSARSYVEESNLFVEADVSTPRRPQPRESRPAVPRAPAVPPQPASPPSVLKRPPRRPGGITPGRRTEPTSGAARPQPSTLRVDTAVPEADDERQSRQPQASAQHHQPSLISRLLSRLRPSPVREETRTERAESRPTGKAEDHRPRLARASDAFSPWYLLKMIAGAFIMMHAIRLVQTFVRPDLFQTPILPVNWYGWKDWTNNVGQFFPPPLLHPLGVLTGDQYDDLKAYLRERTTTTEAVVDNLKSILPKVVSVRKDKKGTILIANEFWDALRDRIQKDTSIMTLDGKSRFSDKHWKAVEQRLKDAGLLAKPLSAQDVEGIVDKSVPGSWERWLQKNERKVADLLGKTLPKDSSKGQGRKGSDETTVSRQEFLRELTEQLAKNKKEITTTMESLRQELFGLVHEAKSSALAGGMTKAEITALIKQIADKEITRRYVDKAAKGGAAAVDDALRNRVNHFSPGNGAQVDLSLTSPPYHLTVPLFGSKEYLQALKRRPQFLPEPIHALTPWSDPGHCWCAGTSGSGATPPSLSPSQNTTTTTTTGTGTSVNPGLGLAIATHPATLAVKLPNFIIPQYLVLEHIDPGATTDPASMPRDVEVWAHYDEHARRERVLDWSVARWPDDINDSSDGKKGKKKNDRNKNLVGQGLVKIGEMRYEHRAGGGGGGAGGVFVHKLADELWESLGAATDLVVVRAVSNYGAEDHTCFYRVRLYGEQVEMEAERKSRFW